MNTTRFRIPCFVKGDFIYLCLRQKERATAEFECSESTYLKIMEFQDQASTITIQYNSKSKIVSLLPGKPALPEAIILPEPTNKKKLSKKL